MSRASRHAERGLTLLEVLGAVMLLAILYSVLATKTSQGVWNEANARSRLEASLHADAALAELETAFAQGATPARERRELDVDGFRIVTEVSDFALPGDPVESPEGIEQAPVFGDASGRQASVAVRLLVHVFWDDGTGERSVERLSFGFDRAAAEALTGVAEEEAS